MNCARWLLWDIYLTDDNQILAGICDAISIIMGAIAMNIKSPDVCEFGCGALKVITTNGK